MQKFWAVIIFILILIGALSLSSTTSYAEDAKLKEGEGEKFDINNVPEKYLVRNKDNNKAYTRESDLFYFDLLVNNLDALHNIKMKSSNHRPKYDHNNPTPLQALTLVSAECP